MEGNEVSISRGNYEGTYEGTTKGALSGKRGWGGVEASNMDVNKTGVKQPIRLTGSSSSGNTS